MITEVLLTNGGGLTGIVESCEGKQSCEAVAARGQSGACIRKTKPGSARWSQWRQPGPQGATAAWNHRTRHRRLDRVGPVSAGTHTGWRGRGQRTAQGARTAYREAVRILSAKGLVHSRPRVGTRVVRSNNGICSIRTYFHGFSWSGMIAVTRPSRKLVSAIRSASIDVPAEERGEDRRHRPVRLGFAARLRGGGRRPGLATTRNFTRRCCQRPAIRSSSR